MVHFTDEAIILSAKKHGETSAVLRLFAKQHGVYAGVMKGAYSKTNRGIIQPGNQVNATWQARLAEHMGMIKLELLRANAALIMADAAALATLSSACALIERSFAERHPYPRLYKEFSVLLNMLTEGGDWAEEYVKFELTLLAESGFGLDLGQCAATGSREDLLYVSPKSGRAVSRQAGEPYKEKLLPLPSFLQVKSDPAIRRCYKETLAGLRLSGYFLDSWLLGPHGKRMPASRGRLIELLGKDIEHHGRETAKN